VWQQDVTDERVHWAIVERDECLYPVKRGMCAKHVLVEETGGAKGRLRP
jgi:hypothetical protein